jgi:hypothetical protein
VGCLAHGRRDTIKSFAIVTTAANDLLEPLHNRMPVLLPPDRWAPWLGEHRLGEKPATDTELKAMLKPYPGAAMTFWPVDRQSAMSAMTRRICSRRSMNRLQLVAGIMAAGICSLKCRQSRWNTVKGRGASSGGHGGELHPSALPYIV